MPVAFLLFLSIFVRTTVFAGDRQPAADKEAIEILSATEIGKYISADILGMALRGYHLTDTLRRKNILTIIDYSKPSGEKRFFVLDVPGKKLLYHCLVAHGKNSGEIFAVNFSNKQESLKSSLGFFLAAETYYGKHGYALRIDGLEKGFNDNARSREIVIHGAWYVSDEVVAKYGQVGKSWGCPALPVKLTTEIINRIANGSCIFIYAKDEKYLRNSLFLNKKE